MSADLPSDQASKPLTPEVTWAQRSSTDDAEKNFIWLTILASDVDPKSMKLDVQPTSVKFSGYSDSKKANYDLQLDFYAEIDPSASKTHHNARALELKLQKKEKKEEYWPRLLKDTKKAHFLKTDFDKWVDEDEQEGVPDDDYMNQMGGGGMPGMGGMGGMGGDGGFGGLDFSKLGGAGGGMPDMSAMQGMMGGMGGAGGDDDGDDDDDMPELEDEGGVPKDENSPPADKVPEASGSTGASATKTGKIEEVE